jgi:hypothetical protein
MNKTDIERKEGNHGERNSENVLRKETKHEGERSKHVRNRTNEGRQKRKTWKKKKIERETENNDWEEK